MYLSIVQIFALSLIVCSLYVLINIAIQSISKRRFEATVNAFLVDATSHISEHLYLSDDRKDDVCIWVIDIPGLYMWGTYNKTHPSDTVTIYVVSKKGNFILSPYSFLESGSDVQIIKSNLDLVGRKIPTLRINVRLEANLRRALITKIEELNTLV